MKIWAGRVALARLDYAETMRLLKGVETTEARGLRGRAEWYSGDIEKAADELEAMLQDPEVHDGWAKAIAGLARRGARERRCADQIGYSAARDYARTGQRFLSGRSGRGRRLDWPVIAVSR